IPGTHTDEADVSSPRVLYEIPLPSRPMRPPAHARPDGAPTNTHGLSPLVERLSRRRSAERARPLSTPAITPMPDSVDATQGLSPSGLPQVEPDSATVDLRSVEHPENTEHLQVSGSSDETDVEIPEADVTEVDTPQAADPEADATAEHPEATPEITFETDSAPGPFDRRSLLPGGRGSLLALLLLGEAVILPGYREGELIAPWTELASPGSTTFTAATFFVLLLVMERLSLSATVKAVSGVVLSTALVLFGYLLMGSAVGLDAFDGQPALTALFRGPLSLRVILVLCAITLPAALLWHREDEDNPGARTVIVAGVALVFFAYLALNRVGLGGANPMSALVDAGLGSLFLGDRVAAWVSFLPGLVAIASLTVLVPRLRNWEPEALAGLFWATLVAPLFVLALYVAPMGDWLLVLEPLQVVSTLAAGLLLAPAALASLLNLSSVDD
ncbi:MAG: hypothetical protein VX938_08510, partial [Myxococcota bacterium]|nr:hypothetical protein [Myxococcota bacterium]